MIRNMFALAAISLAAPAYATTYTLTFDQSDACLVACTIGSDILQSYGDVAGQVDVVYDANRATPELENLYYWSTGYETLTDVAYGINRAGGLSITINALTGFQVSLLGFDIAPYNDRVVNTSVAIIDLLDESSSVFFQTFTPLSNAAVTPFSFAGPFSYTSTGGFRIELGPDAWDVAIDNVMFNVSTNSINPPPPPNPSAIPLPAAGWMLLASLGGFAALRRRTRQD